MEEVNKSHNIRKEDILHFSQYHSKNGEEYNQIELTKSLGVSHSDLVMLPNNDNPCLVRNISRFKKSEPAKFGGDIFHLMPISNIKLEKTW